MFKKKHTIREAFPGGAAVDPILSIRWIERVMPRSSIALRACMAQPLVALALVDELFASCCFQICCVLRSTGSLAIYVGLLLMVEYIPLVSKSFRYRTLLRLFSNTSYILRGFGFLDDLYS